MFRKIYDGAVSMVKTCKKVVVGCALAVGMAVSSAIVPTPAHALGGDTSVADMFALVDLSAVSTGQKTLYGVLIICTLISVAWAIVTKITKKAPRAV